MSNYLILSGDMVTFLPNFGNRIVTPTTPGVIRGTGGAAINKRKICIEGDERSVRAIAVYMTATHPIPGSGEITIKRLDRQQMSTRSKSRRNKVLKKGQQFTASFRPLAPAMTPLGVPDTLTATSGKGFFTLSQMKVRDK